MSATVLPMRVRCPACTSGVVLRHTVSCASGCSDTAHDVLLCICCMGAGTCAPEDALAWRHDVAEGLTAGWAAGVRP